jgi:hypothetical protein
MQRTGGAVFSVIVAVILYAMVARSWMRNWGASVDEAQTELPGESALANPQYQSRRAITIYASAEVVWNWLIQIGQGRGGFYSYDWLENLFNLNIHSTDRIVPEFQDLAPGDFIAAEPGHAFGWRVAEIDEGKSLVLRVSIEETDSAGAPQVDPAAFSGFWIFQLNPIDASSCRLIADFRADFGPGPLPASLPAMLLEPVHFIMERKMLLGIRERAERSYRNEAAG